jgi:hypothetical protein
MFKKLLLLVALPVALAASPALWFSLAGYWTKVTAAISSFAGANSAAATPAFAATPGSAGAAAATPGAPAAKAGAASPASSSSPTGIPFAGLVEVLRFDVSLDWVMNRWPRVSAALAQLQLQGYRVPLVTGTAQDDLAGSLTYYFNPRQEVQRITFHGTTGDARKLVELLTSRYGFARRLTNDASSFVYEVPSLEKKPKSILWIRPAQVVKTDETFQRYQLVLVLERPEKPE